MIRRAVDLSAVVSLVVALAAGYVAAGGRAWVRRATPYRDRPVDAATGKPYDYVEAGVRYAGLYAYGGNVGWVVLDQGVNGLDLDWVDTNPSPADRWRVARDADADAGYLGAIPDDLVPADVTAGVPHLAYRCASADAGMMHHSDVDAWLVNARAAVAISLPLPAGVAVAAVRRRRRRRTVGRCAACGYDLRASPGRCPECGAVRFESRPGLT